MQFDAALAAQETFRRSETDLGSDWDEAVELEETFSSTAGTTAREAYERLLALAARHPEAHSFQAFCIYITWQQVTEETIAHHFQTGVRLCEAYLLSRDAKETADLDRITELYGSFRTGLGLEEEDEIVAEFRRDTPKGGD
jgi:predicted solute-binding protein